MTKHFGFLIAALVAVPQVGYGAECSGSGSYPGAGDHSGATLEARVVKGTVSVSGFSAEPVTTAKQITPLGLKRGMVDDELFELDVDYVYRSHAAQGIAATKLSLVVRYPARRTETLNARVSIGSLNLVLPRMHYKSSMPNVSDVYADLPLPATAGGLFHPSEPAMLIVTDAASGAPLLRAALAFPTGQMVQGALQAAGPNLKTDCEVTNDGGFGF